MADSLQKRGQLDCRICHSTLFYYLLRRIFMNLFFSLGKRTHAGVPGEPQCASPFDGPGHVLGHAYSPPDGRIHFDNEEYFTETGTSSGWFWSKKDSRSLLYVAVHDIGHALGIKHSNVRGRPSCGLMQSQGRPHYTKLTSTELLFIF